MIKVVVTDMDGTLLNEKHEVSEGSLAAIEKLYKADIRFIISTGRHYISAMKTLEKYKLKCDYIVASGAEIRDQEAKVLKQIPMDHSKFQDILDRIKDFPVAARFCSDEYDYVLGTEEEVKESMILEASHFFNVGSLEEIEASPQFQQRLASIKCINSLEELSKWNVPIYKIFIFAFDEAIIHEMDKALSDVEGIVSASSFSSNLELTHIDAQKGIALKEYIEQLGYSMEEIMVLGDSMNDYSMLSMNFGATVAMENAMEEVKKVSKYMTKSNKEDGFAYAIEKLLNNELEDIRKRKKVFNMKNIILDVDGTLWDTTEVVAKAWNRAISEVGGTAAVITSSVLKKEFGKPMNVIADNLFHDVSESQRELLLEKCCEYEHHALEENSDNLLFPEVKETLIKLSEKCRLFIVSNCQCGYIELFMKKTGIEKNVTDFECFGNTGKSKGENIKLVIERNNLEDVVYVGDTQGDYEATVYAGIPFIFAKYGFGNVEDCYLAISEIKELLKLS